MIRVALSAEWTKLRTAPGTVWLLVAVVVPTIGVSAAAAATIACPPGECGVDPARVSLTGIQLGQAAVAVLAVLMVGTEYGTGLMGVTLAAMPRRVTVLAAKAAILVAVVAPAALFAVLGCLVVGRVILPGHGIPVPLDSLSRPAAGSVLYLVAIALLGLGVAVAVRDSATAIGVVLALLYVYPIVIRVVSDPTWLRRLERIGPTAGLAIQATTGLDGLAIGPWRGLGVLAGWATAALLLGALLLHHRDA